MTADKLASYEPPRALRVGDVRFGAGQGQDFCQAPGSGNYDGCSLPGSSAVGLGCGGPGNTASDQGCWEPGNSPSGGCVSPGSSFHGVY